MKFLDFLQEQEEKHAVLAFGRMNPPTTGHEVLVNKVKDIAKKNKATHHIVLSQSQDKEKNPLSAEQKLKHAKRFFPKSNISVATKEHPTFIQQAAKLHQQGVTHLHMVAGSDRTDEYHKLLHKYNGKLYNFKDIKVHSAGERDPDAAGTSGMSASKMRGHAAAGEFKHFKKGIPAHVPEHHAKELFHDVRKGMSANEESALDSVFKTFIVEGVHDKGIFKAVFLGGGPGSGKDFVLDKTLAGHGLTEINSDKALEFLMDKNNLDMKMPESEEEARNVVRSKAKTMTDIKQKLAFLGRNGLIINGTGDDVEKIKRIKDRLESLGYETSMLMVNTANDVSKQRNIERGQRGGRTVPEKIRRAKWEAVDASRPKHAEMFGKNYYEFDNSEDLRTAPAEVRAEKEKQMLSIFKSMQKFVAKPPENENSQEWIANELQKKDTQELSTKQEVTPHEGSNAGNEAKRLGLDYYGFGRYGQKGKVTYRSINDKLVAVNKLPMPANKATNEEFEKFISSGTLNEDYELSDSGSLNLLLLGSRIQEVNYDRIEEKKEDSYVTNSIGHIRTFRLRRAAASEAHQKNGTVIPYKNGYIVKLNKEPRNVRISEETIIQESTERNDSGRTGGDRFGKNTISRTTTDTGRTAEAESKVYSEKTEFTEESSRASYESGTKKKITLSEINWRKKIKLVESIDRGIEPGLSMAGAGEGLGRDMGEKIKKKLGKSVVTPISELTGDTTTASIGDQKEDELKKQGISLSTFKKRNYI